MSNHLINPMYIITITIYPILGGSKVIEGHRCGNCWRS